MIAGFLAAPATAAFLLVGGVQCPVPAMLPVVNVITDVRDPKFFHDKDTQALTQITTDSVFAHAADEIFVTGGITEGRVEFKAAMSYQFANLPDSPKGCLWMDKIDISFVYHPRVHIARDFKPGSCQRKVTTEHELRHVGIDKITIHEYVPKIKADVLEYLQRSGVIGPYAATKMQKSQTAYIEGVKKIINDGFNAMNVARHKRHQVIDTRQEYLKLSALCKGKKK